MLCRKMASIDKQAYIYIYIYILVLTCSCNEQACSGTIHPVVGREVDVASMYVKCVLSVI